MKNISTLLVLFLLTLSSSSSFAAKSFPSFKGKNDFLNFILSSYTGAKTIKIDGETFTFVSDTNFLLALLNDMFMDGFLTSADPLTKKEMKDYLRFYNKGLKSKTSTYSLEHLINILFSSKSTLVDNQVSALISSLVDVQNGTKAVKSGDQEVVNDLLDLTSLNSKKLIKKETLVGKTQNYSIQVGTVATSFSLTRN